MQNGKSTARETELLAATDVAGLLGLKETTVYRWCKQRRLPCLKVGKHWRIRWGDLEDFLRRSERPVTLAGQLVVKTAALEEGIDEWTPSELRRIQSAYSEVILASESGLSLSRATPMPPS